MWWEKRGAGELQREREVEGEREEGGGGGGERNAPRDERRLLGNGRAGARTRGGLEPQCELKACRTEVT